MTHDERTFIEKAIKVHGKKYNYEKVVYKDSQTKVCIICPEHGEFWQTPANHLSGHGCPKCATNRVHERQISSTDVFVKKAKLIHGDKYDYSKAHYTKNNVKICIICPEHGEFWQTPANHLSGQGCPRCGKVSMSKKQTTAVEKFIEKARRIHGNRYDYSKVEYKNANEKVCIICPEHGEFWQTPSAHINGKQGCPACGREKSNTAKILTTESFICKAKEIHEDLYDYSKTLYKSYDEPVEIICKKHGSFYQTPDSHLQGKGCQKCSVSISKNEDILYEFCKKLDDSTVRRIRNKISPYEIDIFVEDKNIGIEYNGLLWHSEKYKPDKAYHYNKLIAARNSNIKLIQIFEDEFINKQNIVFDKIRHILSFDDKPKIMGRKCQVKEINSKMGKLFLEENHIQGFSPSTAYLGAFYNDSLVAVMSFKKTGQPNQWELTRFASKITHTSQGIGGKMFSFFIKTYNPVAVKSFADRRWTVDEDDNLYTKIGFKKEGYTKPDYRYYKRNGKCERIHKFNMRKKYLIKKYGFDNSMTENEMTEKLDYLKVYDCGLIKYVWKKNNP